MEEFLYAQVNEEGLCVGLSQLAGEVVAEGLLPVTQAVFGTLVAGRSRFADGEWVLEEEPLLQKGLLQAPAEEVTLTAAEIKLLKQLLGLEKEVRA